MKSIVSEAIILVVIIMAVLDSISFCGCVGLWLIFGHSDSSSNNSRNFDVNSVFLIIINNPFNGSVYLNGHFNNSSVFLLIRVNVWDFVLDNVGY